MSPTLLEASRALADDLVAVRRDLHRHPELGFHEVRTAALVAGRLDALGLSVRRNVGVTGVVAELYNGPGRRVALRADMDALPIQEEGEHEYRSTVAGVMHACGHDAHTAALLGAAALLVQARERGELPAGSVRFLFQPSEERSDEEGVSGAARMIEGGALAGVDAVVGLHVGAHLPSGAVFVGEGPVMAGSEELTVVVHGQSAHAARPHEGIDALLLAAQGLLAVQQAVSRRISPMEQGVVSFGRIEGGSAHNALADRVRLDGTLRFFEPAVRERLSSAVLGAFSGLEALGARVEVRIGPGYPPVVNDPEVTGVVRQALAGVAGESALRVLEPMMLAEDFAYLAREVPGTFFWVGAALPDAREHHHPCFDLDETVLPLAAAALAASALALLRAD